MDDIAFVYKNNGLLFRIVVYVTWRVFKFWIRETWYLKVVVNDRHIVLYKSDKTNACDPIVSYMKLIFFSFTLIFFSYKFTLIFFSHINLHWFFFHINLHWFLFMYNYFDFFFSCTFTFFFLMYIYIDFLWIFIHALIVVNCFLWLYLKYSMSMIS